MKKNYILLYLFCLISIYDSFCMQPQKNKLKILEKRKISDREQEDGELKNSSQENIDLEDQDESSENKLHEPGKKRRKKDNQELEKMNKAKKIPAHILELIDNTSKKIEESKQNIIKNCANLQEIDELNTSSDEFFEESQEIKEEKTNIKKQANAITEILKNFCINDNIDSYNKLDDCITDFINYLLKPSYKKNYKDVNHFKENILKGFFIFLEQCFVYNFFNEKYLDQQKSTNKESLSAQIAKILGESITEMYFLINFDIEISRIEFISGLDTVDIETKINMLNILSSNENFFCFYELSYENIFNRDDILIDFIFDQIIFNYEKFESNSKSIFNNKNFYKALKILAFKNKIMFFKIIKKIISQNTDDATYKINYLSILHIALFSKNIDTIELLINTNKISKELIINNGLVYNFDEELPEFQSHTQNNKVFKIASPAIIAILTSDLETIKLLENHFDLNFATLCSKKNFFYLTDLSIKIVKNLTLDIIGDENIQGIIDDETRFINFIGTNKFSTPNSAQELFDILFTKEKNYFVSTEELNNQILKAKKTNIEKLIKAKMVADYFFEKLANSNLLSTENLFSDLILQNKYLLTDLLASNQKTKALIKNSIISSISNNTCLNLKTIIDFTGFEISTIIDYDLQTKSKNAILTAYLNTLKTFCPEHCDKALNEISNLLIKTIEQNLKLICRNIDLIRICKKNISDAFFMTKILIEKFAKNTPAASDYFNKFEISQITNLLIIIGTFLKSKNIAQNKEEIIYLKEVICNGIKSLIDSCIEKGSKVDGPNNENSALVFSCGGLEEVRLSEITGSESFTSVARHLIEKHGANVNKRDSRGNSPLLIAAVFTKASAIKALLENGAEKNAINGIKTKDFLTILKENHSPLSQMLYNKYNKQAELEADFDKHIEHAEEKRKNNKKTLDKIFRTERCSCLEEFKNNDNQNNNELNNELREGVDRLFLVNCGHSICKECAKSLFINRKDGRTVKCPTCRAKVDELEFDSNIYDELKFESNIDS